MIRLEKLKLKVTCRRSRMCHGLTGSYSGPKVRMWEVASSIDARRSRADDELFGFNVHLQKNELFLRLPLARKSSGKHSSPADRTASRLFLTAV